MKGREGGAKDCSTAPTPEPDYSSISSESTPAPAGAPHHATNTQPPLIPPPPLQVALAIQGSGEGHVVEGPGDSIGPRVGRHAGDAVLCLVGGQLPPQLLRCDEVLVEEQKPVSIKAVTELRGTSKVCLYQR